jgi:hypothetical protein
MNTKRIRELCHAVSFDDLDRSSRHDILEILLAEEDRLTAPAAPVAPPTTAGPSVTFDDIEIRTALNNLKAGRVTVRCVIDWLRERGVRVLPDAGKVKP